MPMNAMKYKLSFIIAALSILLQESLIYAATWGQYGRHLRHSANITNGNITGEIFPLLKYGLNGRHMIIGTNTVCMRITTAMFQNKYMSDFRSNWRDPQTR